MTTRILFVCLGNICRSPTAEGVFRKETALAGFDALVDSAGTSAWHIGGSPDPRSVAEAASRGLDLSVLRARQITSEDFSAFDLILAMDRSNLAKIESLRPDGNETTVRLFLDFLPDQPVREVPDPYYSQGFSGVFDLIGEASKALILHLAQDRPAGS